MSIIDVIATEKLHPPCAPIHETYRHHSVHECDFMLIAMVRIRHG